MGFTDRAANHAYLAKAHGDVEQAIKGLVAEERREGCKDAA